jgi:hypothetical protein
MSLYFLSNCSSSRLIMMLRFHSGACLFGFCGKWVHMQSVGGEKNEDRCLFLWLVQYGTRGKCPSCCCKNFFVSFSNCSVILTSFFNWTCQSFHSQSNNVGKTRHCWCLYHKKGQKVLGVLWAKLCQTAFSSMAIRS